MANIGALAFIGVIGAGGFLITHQDSADTPPKPTVSAEAQAVSDQIERDRATATPRPTWDTPTVPPSVDYPFEDAVDDSTTSAGSTADSLSAKSATGNKTTTAKQKQQQQKQQKQPKTATAKQPKTATATTPATTNTSPTTVPTAPPPLTTTAHMPSTVPSTATAPNFVSHGVKIH